MERNQAGRSWISKAITFSLASSLAGLITGAALGAVGGLLSLNLRAAIASVLALIAIVLGGFELSGSQFRLPQCDRETPQRWVHTGPLRWAVRNGLALGFGATSRIGFWLWYAIPLGALLFARPDLGAVIYGTYSLTRGMAVWVIILGVYRLVGPNYPDWLIGRAKAAHLLAAGQLLLLGVAGAVAVGL